MAPEIQPFLYPTPFLAFLIWQLSDHLAPETWLQIWLHNNWSPSLPRPLQTPSLVHWQLGQHPSACQSMTGIPKIPIILSPYFAISWRTSCSSTAFCQTARTTSDTSLQLGEPNPWRCMHNGCLPAAKRNRKQPRQKLLPSLTKSNREWHTTSTPMCTLENSKILWPGQERPPRSHCMHQDTDRLLQDDQWWASWAWTASPYHLCILPWGKAPQKTYGQAIQDTLQQAGWHCCEPLCHPTCQGTSLPQLQNGGCYLPGQAVSSPHQPQ